MKKELFAVVVSAVLIQACSTSPENKVVALDGRVAANEAYVGGVDQNIVTSGSGECLRSINWSSENVVVECEASSKTTLSFDGKALFEFDSDLLTAAGQQELQALVAKINLEKVAGSIEIVGHADSTGTEAYNQDLSERRAKTVHRYLGAAVDNMNMQASGMGETAPVADNTTAAGRQKNRRVEILVQAD